MKEGVTMPITMKAARVNAGLSQEDVCRVLNIGKATLISYENGKTVPRIDTAVKMAKLYNLSVNDIIFFED